MSLDVVQGIRRIVNGDTVISLGKIRIRPSKEIDVIFGRVFRYLIRSYGPGCAVRGDGSIFRLKSVYVDGDSLIR